MTSRTRYLCMLAFGCWLAACGAESRTRFGGESNWLRECSEDGDCPDGSCLCGVCTSACQWDTACTESFAGTCTRAGKPVFERLCAAEPVGSAEASGAVCLPSCEADRDCGRGFACAERVCVPARAADPEPPQPVAGASGAAGAESQTDPDPGFIPDDPDPLRDLIASTPASGWRQSIEPLCARTESDVFAADVWSNDSHVVVAARSRDLGSGMAALSGNACTGTACELVTIHVHDGQGWTSLVQRDAPPLLGETIQLTGAGESAVVWASSELAATDEPCRLAFLDPARGAIHCAQASLPSFTDVFAVEPGLIYAMGAAQVVRFDGGAWGPLAASPAAPDLAGAFALWGSADTVFAGGDFGLVLSWRDGTWASHDTRTLDAITAFWGEAGDDVWAGTSSGRLLHYDGEQWRERGKLECEGIWELWGAQGVLYVMGERSIARHDGSELQVLTSLDCGTAFAGPLYHGLWGNSPTEVFVLADIVQSPADGCGPLTLLRFDGSAFHRM